MNTTNPARILSAKPTRIELLTDPFEKIKTAKVYLGDTQHVRFALGSSREETVEVWLDDQHGRPAVCVRSATGTLYVHPESENSLRIVSFKFGEIL